MTPEHADRICDALDNDPEWRRQGNLADWFAHLERVAPQHTRPAPTFTIDDLVAAIRAHRYPEETP